MSGNLFRTTLLRDVGEWYVFELCEPMNALVDLGAESYGYEGPRDLLTIITDADKDPGDRQHVGRPPTHTRRNSDCQYISKLCKFVAPDDFYTLRRYRATLNPVHWMRATMLKAHEPKEEYKTFCPLLMHGNTVAWPLHKDDAHN